MYFSSNIRHLRRKIGLSQQELAEELNIPRTTLGDYERGHTEPNLNLILQFSKKFSVPIDELLEKDLSIEGIEYLKMGQMKVITITVDDEGKNNIELVNTKAAAGYIAGYSEPEYIQTLPKISIPKLSQGQYRAFEINGNSMPPLETGSIVICEYLESIDQVKDNKTYVVVSDSDGVAYKRLIKNESKKQLILNSDNPEYIPYTISYEDITELWSYVAHISFQEPRSMQSDLVSKQFERLEKKIDALR